MMISRPSLPSPPSTSLSYQKRLKHHLHPISQISSPHTTSSSSLTRWSSHDLLLFLFFIFGLFQSAKLNQNPQQAVVMEFPLPHDKGNAALQIEVEIYRLMAPELSSGDHSLPCSSNSIIQIPTLTSSPQYQSSFLSVHKLLRIPRFTSLPRPFFREKEIFEIVPNFLIKPLVMNPPPLSSLAVPHRFGQITAPLLPRSLPSLSQHLLLRFSFHLKQFQRREDQIVSLWIRSRPISHHISFPILSQGGGEDVTDSHHDVDPNDTPGLTSDLSQQTSGIFDSLNANEVSNQSLHDQGQGQSFHLNKVSQQIF
jgi:hypothetical protein